MSTRPHAIIVTALALWALVACGAPQRTSGGGTSSPQGDAESTASGATVDPWENTPSDVERGVAAMHDGRFTEAVAWFDRAIDTGEDVDAALMNRSVARLALSMASPALHDAAAAAATADPAAVLNLAAVQTRLGLHSDAEPALRALIGHAEFGTDAARLLAVGLVETDRAEEAFVLLQDVLAAAQITPGLLNDVGIAAEAAGRAEDARMMYERAIGIDVECIEAWRNLGMLELRAGNADDAEAALERYLLLAPASTIDRGVIQGRLDGLREP